MMIMTKGWKDATLPVHEGRLHEQRHSPGQDHHLVHLRRHHHHHYLGHCPILGISKVNHKDEEFL